MERYKSMNIQAFHSGRPIALRSRLRRMSASEQRAIAAYEKDFDNINKKFQAVKKAYGRYSRKLHSGGFNAIKP